MDQPAPDGKRAAIHLNRIFDLAINKYYPGGKNPAAWKTLQYMLPDDPHRVEHHKSVPHGEMGRFMEKTRAYVDDRRGHKRIRTTVSFAVEFIALTGARGNEVRKAQWKEIDIGRMVWTAPWQNLKMGHKHHTDLERPITKSMLAVLEEIRGRRLDRSPDAFVFPAKWAKDGMLNRPNFNQFIREQLGWEIDATNHGFRSTLKDWCRANKFPEAWYEIQVDHALGNKVGQAYGHDKLLDQRRGMMELWDEYCSKPAPEPKAGEVVNLSDKRRSA